MPSVGSTTHCTGLVHAFGLPPKLDPRRGRVATLAATGPSPAETEAAWESLLPPGKTTLARRNYYTTARKLYGLAARAGLAEEAASLFLAFEVFQRSREVQTAFQDIPRPASKVSEPDSKVKICAGAFS